MTHIAVHAAERLESLDLTRCTSISDAGFHSWGVHDFRNLRKRPRAHSPIADEDGVCDQDDDASDKDTSTSPKRQRTHTKPTGPLPASHRFRGCQEDCREC